MRNWLEMTPADFGYGPMRKRPTISSGDIKALHTHAKRERRAREKEATK